MTKTSLWKRAHRQATAGKKKRNTGLKNIQKRLMMKMIWLMRTMQHNSGPAAEHAACGVVSTGLMGKPRYSERGTRKQLWSAGLEDVGK